ncbi:class III lanthionine synthetase LanKC N-terminal domain-containing protein [Streptococcus pneumoniae]|nr:serine/threonine protein kinase [Streptococcus pneumoniae]CNA20073.1 serine/threonine protein kinase [Streptococcus pneumoniae]
MSPTANKFITLYPKSESEAKSMICNLTNKLSEFKAPKILSDYQCGMHSPVHYRYGAFLKKQAYDEKNKKVIYLLLDEKRIYFQTTCEVSSKDSAINKYKIEKIIKRSNKGNVYRAIRKSDGQKVIIKQSRPFVNYDAEGEWTALDDIKNEAYMLKKLADKSYTTNLIDEFYIVDDYFLVQEQVDGLNFEEFIRETEYSLNIREKSLDNIVNIVNDIHKLGYKIVDIAPTNFIYTKNVLTPNN